MQLQITGKKIEIGEALRQHTQDKFNDMAKKYGLNPLEYSATFSKDGNLIRCDLEMHLGRGVYVRAYEETDDAYLSLDQAVKTFEKRLQRHKKRLVDHHKKKDVAYEKMTGFQYVINPENEKETKEDQPLIIAEMKTDIPSLTVSEAVMHLDLSDAQAILFKNEAHNQLNVVYRRSDGNIGWIAPTQHSD